MGGIQRADLYGRFVLRRLGTTGILLAIVLAFGWFPPLNDAVYPPPEASVMVSPVPASASPTPGASPSPTALIAPTSEPTTPDASPGDVSVSGQSGTATWFCLEGVSRCTYGVSDGMYAAIRRDLLFLLGRRVRVCADRCIEVTIIDCNCGPSANLIDLYSTAFLQLAPLSDGRVRVTVEWTDRD